MTISLKTLKSDWAKAGGSNAKDANNPITKFVTVFTTVIKEYDRARFVDGVTGNNAAGDTKRYVDAFDKYAKDVAKLQTAGGLTPKEKTFLGETSTALKTELQFWQSDPIANRVAIDLHADLRKHWSTRKAEAQEVFKKLPQNTGKPFPLKFDEDFGPLLDKMEKAKKVGDQKKLAIKVGQVARSYQQKVKQSKAALGDVPFDLLDKQLTRIEDAVKRVQNQ